MQIRFNRIKRTKGNGIAGFICSHTAHLDWFNTSEQTAVLSLIVKLWSFRIISLERLKHLNRVFFYLFFFFFAT